MAECKHQTQSAKRHILAAADNETADNDAEHSQLAEQCESESTNAKTTIHLPITKETVSTPRSVISKVISSIQHVETTDSQQTQPSSICIISDINSMNEIRNSLNAHNFKDIRRIELSEFLLPDVRQKHITQFMNNSPTVLWLNIPDEMRKLADSTRLATALATVLFSQLNQGRHVVLQGCVANVRGWHPEVFKAVLEHPRLSHKPVFLCRLGIKDKTDKPLCHYARMYTTLALQPLLTTCCGNTDSSKLRSKRKLFAESYSARYQDAVVEFMFCNPAFKLFPAVTLDADEPGEHADMEDPKPLKQQVEEHYDDCGEDTTALDFSDHFQVWSNHNDAHDDAGPNDENDSDE